MVYQDKCFFLSHNWSPTENAFCINLYSSKKIPPESAMGKKIQSAILLVYKSKVKNNNDKIKYRQGVPMNGLYFVSDGFLAFMNVTIETLYFLALIILKHNTSIIILKYD